MKEEGTEGLPEENETSNEIILKNYKCVCKTQTFYILTMNPYLSILFNQFVELKINSDPRAFTFLKLTQIQNIMKNTNYCVHQVMD